MKRKAKIWLVLISMIFLATSCDTTSYQIPYVQIELYLNIISELGNPVPGSYKLIDGGVNGLIVYRDDYNFFHVYDRTCTLYPDHNSPVVPDTTFMGVFYCPECKSQYLLSLDAEPISGSAVFGLHEYMCIEDGNILKVIN